MSSIISLDSIDRLARTIFLRTEKTRSLAADDTGVAKILKAVL